MNTNEISVLVIEDLNVAQIIAMNVFKKLNCKVYIVVNATKALEQLLLKRFDIVFIDIQLPDINGFELAQTIRSLQHKNRIPLIAVTANSNEDLESKSKTAGFDDFMIKPLSIESVRYMLNKHLNKMSSAKK